MLRTIFFSFNPFPTAPGSVSPCPASINTFIGPPGNVPLPEDEEELNRAFQVVGPTTPSVSIPLADWKLTTADLVAFP